MLGRVKEDHAGRKLVHVFDGSLREGESRGSCGRWYAGGDERFAGTRLERGELELASETFYESGIMVGPFGTLGGGELSKLYDELTISLDGAVATLATRRVGVENDGEFLYLPDGMRMPLTITPEIPERILSIVAPDDGLVMDAAHMLNVPVHALREAAGLVAE